MYWDYKNKRVQDPNGIKLGFYMRTDNKKIRLMRRIHNYREAGYEDDPIVGERLAVDESEFNESDAENKNSDSNESKDEIICNFMEIGIKAWNSIEEILNDEIQANLKMVDTPNIASFKGSLVGEPLEFNEHSVCSDFTQNKVCKKYLKNLMKLCKDQDSNEENDDQYSCMSVWFHLKFALLILLRRYINGKSNKRPIFERDWDLSKLEDEEYVAFVLIKGENPVKERVQNFIIDLCYKSLFYYYTDMKYDFKVREYVVYWDTYEEAKQLASIEDMSYLLLKLVNQNLKIITKNDPIDIKDTGAAVVFNKLEFKEYM